jgi:competence protein ComEA
MSRHAAPCALPGLGLMIGCAVLALVGVTLARAGRQPAGAAPAAPPDMRVEINRAAVAELLLLPAIGPALSQRIVLEREARGPFGSLEDLRRVRGIGPATVERLRPYALTEAPPAP